jgi:hypothetical protein
MVLFITPISVIYYTDGVKMLLDRKPRQALRPFDELRVNKLRAASSKVEMPGTE